MLLESLEEIRDMLFGLSPHLRIFKVTPCAHSFKCALFLIVPIEHIQAIVTAVTCCSTEMRAFNAFEAALLDKEFNILVKCPEVKLIFTVLIYSARIHRAHRLIHSVCILSKVTAGVCEKLVKLVECFRIIRTAALDVIVCMPVPILEQPVGNKEVRLLKHNRGHLHSYHKSCRESLPVLCSGNSDYRSIFTRRGSLRNKHIIPICTEFPLTDGTGTFLWNNNIRIQISAIQVRTHLLAIVLRLNEFDPSALWLGKLLTRGIDESLNIYCHTCKVIRLRKNDKLN